MACRGCSSGGACECSIVGIGSIDVVGDGTPTVSPYSISFNIEDELAALTVDDSDCDELNDPHVPVLLAGGAVLMVPLPCTSAGDIGPTGNTGPTGPPGPQGADASTIQTINAQTTNAYTLVLGDATKLITMTNAGTNVVTVPLNSSVGFQVGTHIDIAMMGAGVTSVAAAVGVTIRSAGGSLTIGDQYGAVTLIKLATNTWLLIGLLD